MSFSYLPILSCCYFSCFGWGGRVESFFFSPLRMSDVPLGRLPTAHRSFSFQGLLKGRDSGMQGLRDKILPEPARVEIFPGNRKRPDLAAPNNPGITFAPATKMTTDAVWKAARGHWHTLGEAERKRKKVCGMAQRATGIEERAAQRAWGKLRFPAAVTEVPWLSLSCGHGLQSRVFLRRHLPPNGLACHCPVWQGSRARRFGGRKHVTSGNGRRGRFTPACPASGGISGCPNENEKKV